MAITPSLWSRRVEVTVSGTIPTLSGYVGVITVDNVPTEMIDAGANSALNGGGDIRVCLNSDGTSQLPLEVVSFVTSATPANRQCVLWVRFPSFTTGSSCWLFYGKADETHPPVTDTFGRNAVWVDYHRVYHLNESLSTASGNYIDSSGNQDATLNSTVSASKVSGLIDSAVNTVSQGAGGAPVIDTGFLPTSSNIFGLEHIVKYNSVTPVSGAVNGSDDASNRRLYVGIDNAGNHFVGVGSGLTGFGTGNTPSGYSTASYNFQSVVADSGTARVYSNGVQATTFSYSFSGSSANSVWILGRNRSGVEARLNGAVDEFRIPAIVKTADTISTEYTNQSSPNTFWSTGTPENTTGGGTGVTANTSITIPAPLFASTASATQPQPIADATITIPAPTFSATGTATLPQPVADIAYTISAPVFSATASATLPQPISDIAITINAPTFAATASATIPGFTSTVAITIPEPQFSSTASVTLPQPSADIGITIPEPVFSASATASLPQPVSDVAFTVSAPLFSATATATLPGYTATVNVTIPEPVFSASGSVTLPQPDAAVSLEIPAPVFSVVAIVGGIAIIVDNETNINAPALSNNIDVQALSNNINA